jgi:phosphate starvation-inducible PhoH-like protein
LYNHHGKLYKSFLLCCANNDINISNYSYSYYMNFVVFFYLLLSPAFVLVTNSFVKLPYAYNNPNTISLFFSKKDGSHSNSDHKKKALSPAYSPRSENQRIYLEHLTNPHVKIVLGVGPAGCGKTLFACYSAIDELKKGNIKKIIITRPLVSVDKEDIGFLPGTLVNKMDPWTRPILDIFLEFYNQRDVDIMLESGVIEISPLAYMRGRTFKRCFIIADEMQNSSPNQMLMMTTRIGEGTKLVITGDLKQSDRSDENGLVDLMKRLKQYNNNKNISAASSATVVDPCQIHLVELKSTDVERSPVVVKILDIYKNKPFEDGKIDVVPVPSFVTLNGGSSSSSSESGKGNNSSSIEIINKTISIVKDNSKQFVKTVIQEIHDNDCAIIPKRDMNKYLRYKP